MYEVLTGERLFVHAGLTTSADEIYSQPVPHVSRKVPGLTPELDAVMQKALSIAPEARYQTAGEFQEALMRCAHRNGLLMAAPELAEELGAACGPRDQWRDDGEDDDFGPVRAGTEIYDPGEELDEDDSALEIGGPMSIHGLAARAEEPRSSSRLSRPKTEMGKFQGVELTSIINMIDLEQQGSKPLVDVDTPPAAPPPPSRDDDSGHIAPGASASPSVAAPPRRARKRRDSQLTSHARKQLTVKPWIVIAALVVLAGLIALVLAVSGPDLPAQK
jgi:hypothetical protein